MLSESFQSVIASLKKAPRDFSTIHTQLEQLHQEELTALYTWIVLSGETSSLNCFKELFKKGDKQNSLVIFLSHNPIKNLDLLSCLVDYLNEEHLLSLLEQHLEKIHSNSSFISSLNQVLFIFCTKLFSSSKHEASLHSWTEKSYAKELVSSLLHSPECILSLSQTHSLLYGWISWTSNSHALEHRIDAVLNHSELEPAELTRCALIWLEHFQGQPQHLLTIFSNLHSTEANRTAIGKNNLSHLKQAIWTQLLPETPFEEKNFLALFKKPLKINFTLTSKEQNQFYHYHQSLCLANSEAELPQEYSPDPLVELLSHSTQSINSANWTKASAWVEKQDISVQLQFLKTLIKKDANVLYNQQAYYFITQCRHIKIHEKGFNEEELSWLLQYSKTDEHENWLTLIKESYEAGTTNLGLIFSYLPDNELLLQELLSHELFSHPQAIASIFAQLHLEREKPTHIMILLKLINNKEPSWTRQFLQALIAKVKGIETHLMIPFILNGLILNSETAFNIDNLEDKKIISNYLVLIQHLIKLAKTETQKDELRQLTFNALYTLILQNGKWAQFIFSEASFNSIFTYLVNNLKESNIPIKANPLTQLFIIPAINQLHSKTKADPGIQLYIYKLLLAGPQILSPTQFTLLFNCLSAENKRALAHAILTSPQLQEVQKKKLNHLSASLPFAELFSYFNKRKKNDLFKELASHPEAQNNLSEIQWYRLFTGLSAAEFIDLLNDEQLSVSCRYQYVEAFFKAYQGKPQLIALQLKEWKITNEQLLVLANFVVEEQNQQLLKIIMDDYHLELNTDVLSSIKFNKDSFLHQKTREAAYQGSLIINLQMLEQLPPEDAYMALQQHMNEAKTIHALTRLFSPFTEDKTKVLALLHCAQWLHKLPLIHSLLEIVQFYKQKNDTNEVSTTTALKQTELFQKTIKPLLLGKKYDTTDNLASLYEDLADYCQKMSFVSNEHAGLIKGELAAYDKQVKAIELYSSPRFHELFKPGRTSSSLCTEDEKFLSKGSTNHQECLKKRALDSQAFFYNSFNSLIREAQELKNESINQWLLNQIHFTFLDLNLEKLNLDGYLKQITPRELTPYLSSIQQIRQRYQTQSLCLSNITSSEELFAQLFVFDYEALNQLFLSCDNLNLIFLKNFIILVKAIKALGLNSEQSKNLFLDKKFSEQQEIHWLLSDLQEMRNRVDYAERTLCQLSSRAYCYRNNSDHNHEALQELSQDLPFIPLLVLAEIINSYVPLFTNTVDNAVSFLNTLEKILKSKSQDLLNKLDEKTISLIINTCFIQLESNTALIEQILHSSHSLLCQNLLQSKLKALGLSSTGTDNNDVVRGFDSTQGEDSLAIQRLIYFAQPSEELLPFLNAELNSKIQYNKKLFCSYASLYQNLKLLNATESPAGKLVSWLIDKGLASLKDYLPVMEELEKKKESDPAAYFHWLCWKSYLYENAYKNQELLSKALLDWLKQHNFSQMSNNHYLKKLLDVLAERKQLKVFFAEALKHKDQLNKEQILWLSESSVVYSSLEPDLLSTMVGINSGATFLMLLEKINKQQFSLVKASLENERLWHEIFAKKDLEIGLKKQLTSFNFSTTQMLELIQSSPNQQIKSQLILFFLSQANYLNKLEGHSLLNNFSDKKEHLPSRLNGLIQQIDPLLLASEQISSLEPEAAFSILSCITLFAQLSKEQVRQLLDKIKQPGVLNYWLNHYAVMPNGFFMLAHFMLIAERTILTKIKSLVDTRKEWFIHTLLEHLDLFDKSNKLIQECDKEEHLILALNKYLQGHKHPNYIHFIKQITERLLSKQHVFSLEATQLLIGLHGDPQFTDLNQTTAYLVNHNLKMHAQSGSLELFNEWDHVNLKSMIQLVAVKPKAPENEKMRGLFSQLFPSLFSTEGQASLTASVDPLIDALSQASTTIKAFDYYLIHFKGNPQSLKIALDLYLNFYAQQTENKDARQALYHTATLMTRQELDPAIRELIYQNFLNYPNLYDEHISYCMFLFDAKKTVQHYGLRGTKEAYEQVINLSTLALKKLDPKRHTELITIANRALLEAKTELAFAAATDFFSRLFIPFKRCWIYGWTGFFNPKPPTYVSPIIKDKAMENPIEQTAKIQSSKERPQELGYLLEELKKEYSLDLLTKMIHSLKQWEFKKNKHEELKIRQELHQLFHSLLVYSVKDTELAAWMQKNKSDLIMNRFRLLEFHLANNRQAEATILLKESNEDSPYLHYIIQELSSSALQVSSPINIIPPNKTSNSAVLLDTASSLAYSAWNWASAFSFFGQGNGKEVDNKPSASLSSREKESIVGP